MRLTKNEREINNKRGVIIGTMYNGEELDFFFI